MSSTQEDVQQGRDAYARRAWRDAYELLTRSDRAEPLEPGDIELLANAASMLGEMDEYLTLLERAYHARLEQGEDLLAARSAFWIGMTLAVRGDMAPAGGWFGRGQRLVDQVGGDTVEKATLMLPAVLQRLAAKDYEGAYELARAATEAGRRFRHPDLYAAAAHFQGMVLIKLGRIEEGLAVLDEAMVGVTAGETSPFIAGVVYCGVIALCEEAFEARRAHEWTNALTRWVEEQPQLVSFTGRCLAHRAGIKQLHGQWRDALAEAELAQERCEASMNRYATGQALYQQGEVHRLRGDLAAAEAAYKEASGYGREPQPGLALLRLAQGDVDAAAGALRRALGERTEPLERAVILPAYAEVMLVAGELDKAGSASEELDEIAARAERPMLSAIAAHVSGAVTLASGDAGAALGPLRRALELWRELDAPYEVARARALIGVACRAVGDDDSAELELAAAQAVFEELGAAPDLGRLSSDQPRESHGLTARELEVLRLVAAGKTNRQIAAELVLSEHTVARHVQNIFGKLRVSSRTAATAFAFEQQLV